MRCSVDENDPRLWNDSRKNKRKTKVRGRRYCSLQESRKYHGTGKLTGQNHQDRQQNQLIDRRMLHFDG